jgi:hypothetical protein
MHIELKQISSEDLSSIIKISNKKKAKKVKVEIK